MQAGACPLFSQRCPRHAYLEQEGPVIPAPRRDDGRVGRVEGDCKDGVYFERGRFFSHEFSFFPGKREGRPSTRPSPLPSLTCVPVEAVDGQVLNVQGWPTVAAVHGLVAVAVSAAWAGRAAAAAVVVVAVGRGCEWVCGGEDG